MLSLHEIDFSNRDFWVGFMATSFPTALEEEMDMSLTDLMIENGGTILQNIMMVF